MGSSKSPPPTSMRTIYRVHEHLRVVNAKAYEPETIAIGPYHHRTATLKMMEEHKQRYLDLLLARKMQTLDMYKAAIGELEEAARKCYAEDFSLSREEFVEMLVRDGCFIIELIRKFNQKGAIMCKIDPIFQRDWMMNSLQRDLLLFENQIPFFVLRKLFDLIEAPGLHERLIYLVFKFWENLYPGGVCKRKKLSKEKIKHLLDLLHRCYCPPYSADHVYVDVDKGTENMSHPPEKRNHVLGSICRCFCPASAANHTGRESLIIFSATELKNANVEFRKKGSGTLFDVDFEKGVLLMPPLRIEGRTECFFRNLIAYEQYFSKGQPNYIGDYTRLLNCLIDSPRDVQILSKAGIIDNWLGDNDVVAKIVNGLNETVSVPNQGFIYGTTFEDVNRYCKKYWNRKCATLKRDYCNSPWAFIAFLAASAILLLTVTQTVFSILQVV